MQDYISDSEAGKSGKSGYRAKPGPQSVANWQTIVITYNSGMGSGDAALKASWAPDLQYLLEAGFPCIFTCANDYMDVPGEMEIMLREEARFLLQPCRNPFAAMTTFRPEDHPKEETQANSFVYAVMGRCGKDYLGSQSAGDVNVAGRGAAANSCGKGSHSDAAQAECGSVSAKDTKKHGGTAICSQPRIQKPSVDATLVGTSWICTWTNATSSAVQWRKHM